MKALMKPILFSTAMVRAILDGRKSVTRRVVKPQPEEAAHSPYEGVGGRFSFRVGERACTDPYKPPYRPGDILYVRETWQFLPCIDCLEEDCGRVPEQYEDEEMTAEGCYIYKENVLDPKRVSWRPSIHMPKEAARLFLRVTDVRLERLRDIESNGMELCKEGVVARRLTLLTGAFASLWDSTIKKSDLHRYGWAANPWVWVIAFERISKEEALSNARDIG